MTNKQQVSNAVEAAIAKETARLKAEEADLRRQIAEFKARQAAEAGGQR